MELVEEIETEPTTTPAKKEYSPPCLLRYGSVAKLTNNSVSGGYTDSGCARMAGQGAPPSWCN